MGRDYLTLLQASISLPFLTKPVSYGGRILMDGGLADPVPLQKSMDDGNTRHVLVLTRPKGYRKKRFRLSALTRIRYPRYPGLHQTLKDRHHRYNETMDLIDRLAAEGKVFLIRPREPLGAARIERNPERLHGVYDLGYRDASACHGALHAYLNPD